MSSVGKDTINGSLTMLVKADVKLLKNSLLISIEIKNSDPIIPLLGFLSPQKKLT